MYFCKELVIDSKCFTLVKEGGRVVITERTWKMMAKVVLGPSAVKWLAKAMDGCTKEDKNDFYTTIREGSSSFIAQRCSNARGRYLAVVEYGAGGKRKFIFVPEEVGYGWSKMGEALWELCDEKRKDGRLMGKLSNAKPQSYREALMVVQPQVARSEGGGRFIPVGEATGQIHVREPCSVQGQLGNRQVGDVTDEETLKLLWEAKSQISELQLKIEHLIRKEWGRAYNGSGMGREGEEKGACKERPVVEALPNKGKEPGPSHGLNPKAWRTRNRQLDPATSEPKNPTMTQAQGEQMSTAKPSPVAQTTPATAEAQILPSRMEENIEIQPRWLFFQILSHRTNRNYMGR
ncbi:hypothetical protein I3842_01G280100 [Carya illinoinensis]|uniref:Uncharacterized protein n=1 Tax=Carya illinoinensis TaxID=32201 RepID=A0A922GAD6_CARIL|nr:hypothetical protein I3842_01G280100 [Carya illinoinensis]